MLQGVSGSLAGKIVLPATPSLLSSSSSLSASLVSWSLSCTANDRSLLLFRRHLHPKQKPEQRMRRHHCTQHHNDYKPLRSTPTARTSCPSLTASSHSSFSYLSLSSSSSSCCCSSSSSPSHSPSTLFCCCQGSDHSQNRPPIGKRAETTKNPLCSKVKPGSLTTITMNRSHWLGITCLTQSLTTHSSLSRLSLQTVTRYYSSSCSKELDGPHVVEQKSDSGEIGESSQDRKTTTGESIQQESRKDKLKMKKKEKSGDQDKQSSTSDSDSDDDHEEEVRSKKIANQENKGRQVREKDDERDGTEKSKQKEDKSAEAKQRLQSETTSSRTSEGKREESSDDDDDDGKDGMNDEILGYLRSPKKVRFGVFKVILTIVAGIYAGAFLAKFGANLLEEYEIFVKEDDDDD